MSAGSPRFLDTNILIYAFDISTGQKHQKAKALYADLWANGGYVSMQVLQEFYVNITRKAPNVLDIEHATLILRDLAKWHVHVPNTNDIFAAIELQTRYQVSFWDAMILRSAQQSGCDVLLSEDLSDGQDYEGVKVVNPFKT